MRLDWQKIRALSLDAGLQNSDKALFVLPVAGRDLLMSIFERFTWRATFRTDGYDYADWDELQAIVMETENGLMGTILMDDLIAQITRIADSLEENLCCTEDELNAINTSIQNIELICYGGGGGGGNVFETWRVPVGWEDDFPDNPIPDDDTPTGEAQGDLCDFAHSAHHEIRQWFQAFAENVGAESPYTDIVEYMNLFALVNKSTAWFYQAMTSVISLWYDDLLSDVDEFWVSIKDEFICAVLENDNAAALRGWLFDRIRTDPPTWSAGMYMETLLTGTTFNIIYDGTYNPLPEFIGSDCASCQTYYTENGWYRMFVDAHTNVASQAATVSQAANEIFFNQTLVSDHGSYIYRVSFFTDNTATTPKAYNVEVVSSVNWTKPTNATHPIIFQGQKLDNSYIYPIPYGSNPPYSGIAEGVKTVFFSSGSPNFQLTLRLTNDEP